jgi:hypothetical protein
VGAPVCVCAGRWVGGWVVGVGVGLCAMWSSTNLLLRDVACCCLLFRQDQAKELMEAINKHKNT